MRAHPPSAGAGRKESRHPSRILSACSSPVAADAGFVLRLRAMPGLQDVSDPKTDAPAGREFGRARCRLAGASRSEESAPRQPARARFDRRGELRIAELRRPPADSTVKLVKGAEPGEEHRRRC